MTTDDLERYAQAWNRHDIDGIMAMMTDDCRFLTGGGPTAHGTEFRGAAAVRARFEAVWADVPDARWSDASHFVSGHQGCSAWLFTGTAGDGSALEIAGVDIFEFTHGRIATKSTYLKQRRQ